MTSHCYVISRLRGCVQSAGQTVHFICQIRKCQSMVHKDQVYTGEMHTDQRNAKEASLPSSGKMFC